VVDHCLFLVQPARRADALVVQKPLSILTCNRRSNPRHRVSASSRTVATFWPWTDGQTQTAAQVAHAQIVDYSVGGLGIKADTPLPMKIGEKVVIQLRTAHQPDCLILQGQLRHCTLCEDGAWRAGFGDVAEVEPGQAQGLIEFLASSKQADDKDEA
jgi:hypothetical protein